MNHKNNNPRAVVRFSTPKQIRQPIDQFGCAGFTAYGTVTNSTGLIYVKNPDFDWSAARRNPESIR